MAIDPATAALSDSTSPDTGRVHVSLASSSSSGLGPRASEPTQSAKGGRDAGTSLVSPLEVSTIVRTDDEHLVVTLGLEDVIVVHTPDATLVANKEHEESIRQVVKLLKEKGWEDYL